MPEITARVADTPTKAVVHEAGEKKHTGRLVLGYIGRILLCLVFGLPLLFLIVSSLKPDLQIFSDLTSIKAFLPVGDLTLDNYRGVFDRVPFATFMMNSIIISVVTVGLGLLVNSMAAFALSRITFKGQRLILGIILATLIVPFETMALPLLWWSNKLPFYDFVNGYSQGWLDTYQIQIVPLSPTPSRSSSSTSTSTPSQRAWTRQRPSTGPAGSGSTAASSCRSPDRRSRPSRSSPSCRHGTNICGR